MSIIFQVRGTQLNAYYARFAAQAGYAYGGAGGSSIPAVTADASAGIFGGSYIAKASTVARGLIYPGFTNCPATNVISVLLRIIPRWTGSPAGIEHLFAMSSPSGNGVAKHEIMINTSGQLRVRMTDQGGVGIVLATSTQSWSATSGTPVDLMISWDGTTTSGAYKWSVDGVEKDTLTISSISGAAPVTPMSRTAITLGLGIDTQRSNWDLNELVIYDTAENHVYSTRSAFITPPSTGEVYPAVAAVKTGTTIPLLGSWSTSTGTYDGSDRWTDPGEANVRLGTAYKANSTSNNKTGTLDTACDFPDQSEVLYGVSYDNGAKTGTYGSGPPSGSWAPQQAQFSIYSRLKDDVTLCTLLGTTQGGAQKVFDHVPDNQAYPYVVMQINPWEDRGNYTKEGLQALITVHVWYQPGQGSFTGRGDKQVQLIQKRIDELMHKSQMAISGWRNLVMRRSVIDIILEPDNITRHGVQQFKLFLGEA